MASIIRIKRSLTAGDPSVLAAGELAYSAADYTTISGGGRLYIGIGTESGGDAASHLVIGGKFFTDKLDHAPGTLTPTSALIVDADSKIDNLLVDNLQLNGNTLSSTNTNGNITLDPNGSGIVEVVGDLTVTGTINATISGSSASAAKWTTARDLSLTGDATATLSSVDGTANVSAALTLATVNTDVGTYGSSTSIPVITVNGKGLITGVSTQSISTTLTVASDVVASETEISLADDTLSFIGGEGINTSIIGTSLTISAEDASDTNKGIASFDSSDFDIESGAVSLPIRGTVGTFGSATEIPVITFNSKGIATSVTTETISTSFDVTGNTGLDTFSTGETLSIIGSGAISTAVTDNTVTVSVDAATSTDLGVASFTASTFDVTEGAVTIKSGGVTNAQLENNSVTIGSTEIALGSTSTTLEGLTELTVDDLNFNNATITAAGSATDISVTLAPKGEGTVDVSGSRITAVGTPTQATDAATKEYVDSVAEGLHVHASVKAATTTNIALDGSVTTLDGVSLVFGDRVLVKDQAIPSENGIYVVDAVAEAWTRAEDYNTAAEVDPGDFVFVTFGTTYASTGWVQINAVTTLGTDAIEWDQFSGAGTYLPGQGLSLTGSTFNVLVGDALEFTGTNAINLAATVAGAGLHLTSGVLDVQVDGTTVEISSDTLQIASTYAGQNSITTLGTITTGTWNGTAIDTSYGGTGLSSYNYGDLLVGNVAGGLSALTVGDSGKVLQSNGSTIVYGDVDGGTY